MTPPSFDLLARMYAWALSDPQRTAVRVGEVQESYAQFFSRVQALRQEIEKFPSPLVAVYATPSLPTYAAIVASLFAGRAFLPLNPKNPVARNLEILADSGSALVLFENEQNALFGSLPPGLVRLKDVPSPTEVLRPDPPVGCAPSALAYLFFTSGSTGKSKGVPISRGALNHFCRALLAIPGMDLGPEDRFLQSFDLTFDLANMCYLLPLALGASFYPVAGKQQTFLEASGLIQQQGLTVALLVPSVLTFLSRYFGEYRAPTLRHSLFCGEALDAQLVRGWGECVPQARLWNVYGPTEATVFCSFYEVPRHAAIAGLSGAVSIGEAMAGTQMILLSESGEVIEGDGRGELGLAGPQLAEGYWRDPTRTAKSFPTLRVQGENTRVYRTGDLVERCGVRFDYVGRVDFQVKVDGYRVELGEIEFHAKAAGGFENVVVVARRSGGFTRLHLYYQSANALSAEAQAKLVQYLKDRLPPYMIPSEFSWRRSFPLNTNQKVDRSKLDAA